MPDHTFLDWPFFEDHHRAHAAKLRDWAEKEIAPLEVQQDLERSIYKLVILETALFELELVRRLQNN